MSEHFRGVIWPRRPIKEQYRYVIVGMIITDEPIENIEGKNEVVLDGMSTFSDGLGLIRQVKPAYKLGDANSVLAGLENIVEGE